MTFLILGLDALDFGLVEMWDLEPIQLENYRQIETFSYGHNVPYTLEVWPTIATGLHPRDHGITAKTSSDWENPILDFLSQYAYLLPGRLQSRLGKFFESATSSEFALAETTAETIFDAPNRTVHNWPGVANGRELLDVWNMIDAGYGKWSLEREVLGKAASQFGWAKEMLRHDTDLAGVHIHSLDVLGHAYASEGNDNTHSSSNLQELERIYRDFARRVGNIRGEMDDEDELLILSDHGMTNELTDGPEAYHGGHSQRAFAGTTLDVELPGTVFEYFGWVNSHLEKSKHVGEEPLAMPTEHLRDLGYIE